MEALYRFRDGLSAERAWRTVLSLFCDTQNVWVDYIGINRVRHIVILADNRDNSQVQEADAVLGDLGGRTVEWPRDLLSDLLSYREYMSKRVTRFEATYIPCMRIMIKSKRPAGELV